MSKEVTSKDESQQLVTLLVWVESTEYKIVSDKISLITPELLTCVSGLILSSVVGACVLANCSILNSKSFFNIVALH